METQPREGGWDRESTFQTFQRAEPGFLSGAASCHLPAPPPAGPISQCLLAWDSQFSNHRPESSEDAFFIEQVNSWRLKLPFGFRGFCGPLLKQGSSRRRTLL